MDPPILSVKNISKRYGGRIAIENICFDVFRGEVLALLGPNGAGKTTVLRIVSGVARPDNGYVRINGLDPSDPRVRSLIGYCPQESIVHDDLTGLENMLFYAGLYGLGSSEAKRRCMNLLEFIGLSDYANRLNARIHGWYMVSELVASKLDAGNRGDLSRHMGDRDSEINPSL